MAAANHGTTTSSAGSPSKKKGLTKQNQEEQIQKLYYATMEKQKQNKEKREMELTKLNSCAPAPRKLKPDEEESLIKHLYISQMEKFESQKAKRALELEKANHLEVKKLSESELMDSIDRMYKQEKDKRAATEQRLAKKYQMNKSSKRLDGEAVEAVNERLYGSTKGRFDKLREDLWEKHIKPLQPTFPTLDEERLKAMTERLSTKQG